MVKPGYGTFLEIFTMESTESSHTVHTTAAPLDDQQPGPTPEDQQSPQACPGPVAAREEVKQAQGDVFRYMSKHDRLHEQALQAEGRLAQSLAETILPRVTAMIDEVVKERKQRMFEDPDEQEDDLGGAEPAAEVVDSGTGADEPEDSPLTEDDEAEWEEEIAEMIRVGCSKDPSPELRPFLQELYQWFSNLSIESKIAVTLAQDLTSHEHSLYDKHIGNRILSRCRVDAMLARDVPENLRKTQGFMCALASLRA